MATEHVEEYGRAEQMCGGWDGSSLNRFHPSCSWCPWGNKDSTLDAATPCKDAWDKVSQSEESLGDDLNQASKSTGNGRDDACKSTIDEVDKSCTWNVDGWDQNQTSKSAEEGWDQVLNTSGPECSADAQCQADDWFDLDDSNCELEESLEQDNFRKCSGLLNLGNTCFMNAVLQCLTYTAPFANRIISNEHKVSCQIEGFCLMCALQDHMKVVLAASGRTVSPLFLAHNLSKISRSFSLGQQQDAHEFLLYLMEGLQKCCQSGVRCLTQAGDASSVSDLFIGQMKSQVKCKSCSHCSNSIEPFLGLNLEIENCNSVKEALSNFLAVEELEEENKISCSLCKEVASRSKQLSFSRFPQALVVQLKRYKATESFPTKIEKEIKYEANLDLLPFISKVDDSTSAKESDWKYRLYAVLVHSGWSTSSGHYYCYVQTSPGIWHCMNDSSVSRVSEWTVLHQEAYILFYIQEGIKEELHIENILPAEPDLRVSDNTRAQMPKKIDDPYLCYSPIRADYDNNLLADYDDTVLEVDGSANPSAAVATETLEPSHSEPLEVDIEAPAVCNQVKLPGVTKQIQRDTSASIPAQQDLKNSLSSHECRSAHDLKETKHPNSSRAAEKTSSPSLPSGRSVRKLEEPKPSPVIRNSTSLKAGKISSPSLPSGDTQVVLDSFVNGSQHSFLRLLSKMPSTRRQTLLASALSGQEGPRQSSPIAKSARDTKSKPANVTTKQAQMASLKRSSSCLDGSEQGFHANLRSQEKKPWTGEYDHTGDGKLQRVGGKRVMASFGSSGVHHRQMHGVAKANIV